MRRLIVDDVRGPDVEVGINDCCYLIRGTLTVAELTRLVEVRERIGGIDDPDLIGDAAGEANDILASLIHERYPDADLPDLDAGQSAAVLAMIVAGRPL